MSETNAFASPRIEDHGPFLFAGIEERYDGKTRSRIPEQWRRFGPSIESMPGEIGRAAYGVVTDMTEDSPTFGYLTGVEVAEGAPLPEGFVRLRSEAPRYAVFPHEGHASTVRDTVRRIWREWRPDPGEKIAKSPHLIERYGEAFDPETGMGDIDILIPLER